MARLSGSVSDTWLLAGAFHACGDRRVLAPPFLQRGDLLGQVPNRWVTRRWATLLIVRLGQLGQVAGQSLISVAQHRFELLTREVALVAVDRLQARAVHRQQLLAEEIQLTAQVNEAAESGLEGRGVLAPKVGNRLEVRPQPAQQPDHFQVAVTLRFQAARGAYPVQVAIEVELEQVTRMVAGPPGLLGLGAHEARLGQVEAVDERLDGTHRVVLTDVVLHRCG